MTVFVDTSALYSLLSANDSDHAHAQEAFAAILGNEDLVSHNYIQVETITLVHARHGRRPLPRLRSLFDVIEFVYVEPGLHEAAWNRLLASRRHGPSFVDFVSFELARQLEIKRAFAFDDDFTKEGLQLL